MVLDDSALQDSLRAEKKILLDTAYSAKVKADQDYLISAKG